MLRLDEGEDRRRIAADEIADVPIEERRKLNNEQPLTFPWVAVGILIFGLAAESVSLRACLQEVNKLRSGRSLWRWFRESRQSELVVILGEDLAALLGLALALLAILPTILTGNTMWDALGSMAIGVVLIVVATLIGHEIKGLLIGQSAEHETETRLRSNSSPPA